MPSPAGRISDRCIQAPPVGINNMAGNRIDHVSLRIPPDGLEDVEAFYIDTLGFTPEKLAAYRADERTSFFVRVGERAMINFRPRESFEPPSGENLDHVCLVLDMGTTELRERLEAAGVTITRESTPLGSAGRAPAVYVTDPFGYGLELKAAGDAGS